MLSKRCQSNHKETLLCSSEEGISRDCQVVEIEWRDWSSINNMISMQAEDSSFILRTHVKIQAKEYTPLITVLGKWRLADPWNSLAMYMESGSSTFIERPSFEREGERSRARLVNRHEHSCLHTLVHI